MDSRNPICLIDSRQLVTVNPSSSSSSETPMVAAGTLDCSSVLDVGAGGNMNMELVQKKKKKKEKKNKYTTTIPPSSPTSSTEGCIGERYSICHGTSTPAAPQILVPDPKPNTEISILVPDPKPNTEISTIVPDPESDSDSDTEILEIKERVMTRMNRWLHEAIEKAGSDFEYELRSRLLEELRSRDDERSTVLLKALSSSWGWEL